MLCLLNKYSNLISFFVEYAKVLFTASDNKGIILKVAGSGNTVTEGPLINLRPGADWSEEKMGSNFIGSVIRKQKEAEVLGKDHYCQLLHSVACVGLPVYSSGKLIGVVGLVLAKDKYFDERFKKIISELADLFSDKVQQNKRQAGKPGKSSAFFRFNDIVGESSAIKEAVKVAKMAAKSDLSVLILGESGTGKEVVAQAIHNSSGRKNGPFIAVNCGAFPRELINSELFGYVEGAFTGAKKGGYIGKIEAANYGTLFLDEIGDMSLELQTVLLRVLQDKKITKIGDYKQIPVDIRIITATNKDLVSEISWTGRFRSDLYYRLNAITIKLPPLRDRKEDIPELSRYFLEKIKENLNDTREIVIEKEVLKLFDNYSWPGNVRELKNVIERAYYFTDGTNTILKEHLPEQFQVFKDAGHGKSSAVKTIDQAERDTIKNALERNQWNIKKTAKMLGIARSTLYRKIDTYNISIK